MTRFALSLLLVCLISASAFSQTRTRPRTAPGIKNDATKTTRIKPTIEDPMAKPPPPPASKPTEDEVVRVETNLVTTPVSVLDRSGRFIGNLRKRDFKIFEDGKAQEVTYFQSSEQPFTVILLIDTSPSTRYHIDDIHYAAVTFVNQLRPNDKVMVAAFDSRLKILTEEPTTEKQTIFAAIYKSQFGSGTSLYDAVDYVANMDFVNIPGRKAVVLFTDGVDTTSRRADYITSLASVEEVDALFYPIRYNTQKRQDDPAQVASIYGVNLPPGVVVQLGRGQSDAEYQRGKTYLETLATNSGGRIFEADTTTNLETAFANVAEELRRQYSIGYYASEEGKVGDRKRIKIEVARPPKAIVRSKTTYVVKDKDELARDSTSSR
ncbi:MAG TPA: VWA domain-containing protein [Pyrinomonadaceae bacterium]|nr:VWA domain-containing protein [Pyrinomonadaceae bacterium]